MWFPESFLILHSSLFSSQAFGFLKQLLAPTIVICFHYIKERKILNKTGWKLVKALAIYCSSGMLKGSLESSSHRLNYSTEQASAGGWELWSHSPVLFLKLINDSRIICKCKQQCGKQSVCDVLQCEHLHVGQGMWLESGVPHMGQPCIWEPSHTNTSLCPRQTLEKEMQERNPAYLKIQNGPDIMLST